MEIRGREVTVPVEDILNQFDWHDEKWTDKRLIACSPFRYEKSASFFVRLIAENGYTEGIWSDSGGTGEYKSGRFPKLYAHLKGLSEREAEDELLEIYGNGEVGYREQLTVNIPRLQTELIYRKLRQETFTPQINTYHPYMEGRGISKEIAEELGIGYDEDKKALVFLWKDGSDQLRNVKYRSVKDKIFWYEEDCKPISEMIYNLSTIYKKKPKPWSSSNRKSMPRICPVFVSSVALGGPVFQTQS
jgi:hypothetical protein